MSHVRVVRKEGLSIRRFDLEFDNIVIEPNLSEMDTRSHLDALDCKRCGITVEKLTRRRESIPIHRDRRAKQVKKHITAARVPREFAEEGIVPAQVRR